MPIGVLICFFPALAVWLWQEYFAPSSDEDQH